MSLLTWAEENLTALETCPSDEKEEAEKRLEPEKAPGCRRDQLPVGGPGGKSALPCFYRSPRGQVLLLPIPIRPPQLPRNMPAPLVIPAGSVL